MIQESKDGQKAFKNSNAPVYAVFKLAWLAHLSVLIFKEMIVTRAWFLLKIHSRIQ